MLCSFFFDFFFAVLLLFLAVYYIGIIMFAHDSVRSEMKNPAMEYGFLLRTPRG